MAAFKGGRKVEAHDAAYESWTRGGDPDALELMAVTALHLGRATTAAILYRLLADLDDAPQGLRDRARRQRDALAKQSGLVGASGPDGTVVAVDGIDVATLPEPDGLPVLPGEHRVRLIAPDGRSHESRLRIRRGQRTLAAFPTPESRNAAAAPPLPSLPSVEDAPVPSTGTKGTSAGMAVEVTGASEAVVIVDGVEQGPAPWRGGVSAGKRAVSLRANGALHGPFEVDVVPRRSVAISVEIPPGETLVEVTVSPATAAISVDGKSRGVGRSKVPLSAGEHVVSADLEGFLTARRTLFVVPGRPSETVLVLEPAPPTADVRSAPDATGRRREGDGVEPGGTLGVATLIGTTLACGGNSDCGATEAVSAGLDFSGGYDFRPLGVEGGLTLAASKTNSGTYRFFRSLAALTVGPRLSLGEGFVRLTTSLRVGAQFEYAVRTREMKNSGDSWYVSPAWFADVGLTLGQGPGAHFQLGLAIWGDAPVATVATTRDDGERIILSEGAQLAGGLLFGIRFAN
ncbi:hypothetical protein L6V77_10620 [Myxococcota bacterium]|nr:hypothetical protein [Myxococcota bacterium]